MHLGELTMKKFVIVGLIGVLAACGQKPAEAPATEEAPVEEATPVTVANGTPAGVFDVTMADGSTMVATINADGTYSDVLADGTVAEEGTWTVVDGKTCFSPTTEGATPMCWTETEPGEDGSFTATPDEGDPVTVTPQASASAEAAATE